MHSTYVMGTSICWTDDNNAVKLFGQHLGGEGTVIITEGEFDAMSIYECVHKYHPKRKVVVVSVPNGAQRQRRMSSTPQVVTRSIGASFP